MLFRSRNKFGMKISTKTPRRTSRNSFRLKKLWRMSALTIERHVEAPDVGGATSESVLKRHKKNPTQGRIFYIIISIFVVYTNNGLSFIIPFTLAFTARNTASLS